MKKLSIFLIAIFFMGAINAQEAVVTWDGLKKQKTKSDAAILNPKKRIKPKTWMKRSDIYMNIHTFVLGGLYKGMPAKGGIANVERLVGKPGKIMTKGDEQIWVYLRKELIIKNGVLDSWKQTEFIDKDALAKSGEALLKAVELDKKGKLQNKKTTKEKIKIVKTSVINDAISDYTDYSKDFEASGNKLTDFGKTKLARASKNMALGYKLAELPALANDTAYSKDQIKYFEGIIAYHSKKYDDAKKLFSECVTANYGKGGTFHYLADCYANTGDSAKYIETVKAGFDKHPEEEQLIIDLINYYMVRKEANKAVEYIDIAINKNPDNPSYYSAKATIFDNRTDVALDKYKEHMEKAYEHKKAAFRDRNNASKKAAAQQLRDGELNKALALVTDIEKDLAEAEKLYNKALDVNPKFFNAAYNLGRIYLKHNERNALHADYLLKIYLKKDFAKSSEFETKAKANLKEAANKFELAHKLNKNDIDVLKTLKRIYYRLHDRVNRERVEALIANFSGSTGNGME